MPEPADPLAGFRWERQPEADALLRGLSDRFLARCPAAARLAERMQAETGTRFFDWIDHLALPDEEGLADRLLAAGFVRAAGSEPTEDGPAARYAHPGGLFPEVLLRPGPTVVAIKAGSATDFAAAQGLPGPIEGEPVSRCRWVRAGDTDGVELRAVERHGFAGFLPPPRSERELSAWLMHREAFRLRRREFSDEAEGFAEAGRLIDSAVADLGPELACDLFFAAEREYWERRNRAARVQKARQDRLGLGWANHDHHTYRSSRRHFRALIRQFERLGFRCRERFYAGAEAGWGAQVLEHPVCKLVLFADVDLSPEELAGDFAHEPLPGREGLGTVGLWCALHGEAFLEAGMHHLECQFDFDALAEQLRAEAGIGVMKPFSDFPYLRQAFTEGERWPVRPERIERLRAEGKITGEQADEFRRRGAIGSHLENLERRDGFKGFNQRGVSEIILATDPRHQAAQAGG